MMGSGEAREWRGQLVDEMNQSDIAEARKKARAWLYKEQVTASSNA